MPCGSDRNVLNHFCFARPNISTCVQPSAPQITAQMAMTNMSQSRCRLPSGLRGSGRSEKWVMNRLTAIRGSGKLNDNLLPPEEHPPPSVAAISNQVLSRVQELEASLRLPWVVTVPRQPPS